WSERDPTLRRNMGGEAATAWANQRSRASTSSPAGFSKSPLSEIRPTHSHLRSFQTIRSGRLLAKADTNIWSRPAFEASSRITFILASGVNGLPFSIPSAESSPYIGRNSSTIGSALMIARSFSQYAILSSQRSDVQSSFFSETSTNFSGAGLADVASG